MPHMRQAYIKNDDAPPEDASQLVITQSYDGDIWVSLVPGKNDRMQGVRIRTEGGGGCHPNLVEDFVKILDKSRDISKKKSSIEYFED